MLLVVLLHLSAGALAQQLRPRREAAAYNCPPWCTYAIMCEQTNLTKRAMCSSHLECATTLGACPGAAPPAPPTIPYAKVVRASDGALAPQATLGPFPAGAKSVGKRCACVRVRGTQGCVCV